MYSENQEWLNASIYYTQDNWDKLIRDCINPFIDELDDSIPRLISLNKDRGDNVRLALYASLSDFERLTCKLADSIGAFLGSFPSDSKPLSYPLPTFFLPIPNNSVRYDMYANVVLPHGYDNEDGFQMRKLLSGFISSELSKEGIDDELMVTFSLYLLLAVIRVYCPDISLAMQQLKIVISDLELLDTNEVPVRNGLSGSEEALEWAEMLENNEEILQAICTEIWTEDLRADSLAWLREWEIELKRFSGTKKELGDALPVVWNIISDHVGGYNASQTLIPFLKLINIVLGRILLPEWSVVRENYSVTAVLTVWKRNNLEEQIEALQQQTFPINRIIIYHCGNYVPPDFSLAQKYPNVHYQYNTGDFGYFGRFSAGLCAASTHLYVLDDDVIPSFHWVENSLQLCVSERAIIASAGRVIPPDNYVPERIMGPDYLQRYFFGDNALNLSVNFCRQDTVVDFGCNSWFIKTSWLQHFWSYIPKSFATGEDIHLSVSCNLKAGIRTICPRQDQELVNGNLKKAYGFDDNASWKQSDFLEMREAVLRKWISKEGWRPKLW